MRKTIARGRDVPYHSDGRKFRRCIQYDPKSRDGHLVAGGGGVDFGN